MSEHQRFHHICYKTSSNRISIFFSIAIFVAASNLYHQNHVVEGFAPTTVALHQTNSIRHISDNDLIALRMSDWGSFEAMEDDLLDEDDVDNREYAVEDDSQKDKARVGALVDGPSIENDAEPIRVLPGSQLELSEETVLGLLAACRGELGTLFGYTAENRGVGITGGVDFVEMDGPNVVLRLKGRFWHERYTVLERVSNYLCQRIPEIVDVTVEDEYQLTKEANDEW